MFSSVLLLKQGSSHVEMEEQKYFSLKIVASDIHHRHDHSYYPSVISPSIHVDSSPFVIEIHF